MKFMLNPPKGRLGVLIYRTDGEPDCEAVFVNGRFDTDTLPEAHRQRAIDLFLRDSNIFFPDDDDTVACNWPGCDFLGSPKAVRMHYVGKHRATIEAQAKQTSVGATAVVNPFAVDEPADEPVEVTRPLTRARPARTTIAGPRDTTNTVPVGVG